MVLHGEDLNALLEHFKLKLPKETFRSLLSTNLNVFGLERQKALAILKPFFVYHSPKAIIGGRISTIHDFLMLTHGLHRSSCYLPRRK